jgi:hypothetical protein
MNDKYLVFLSDNYYPSGGWEDFSGYFDSLEMAIIFIQSQEPDCNWAHVVYQDKIIIRASSIEEYKETDEGKGFSDNRWSIELAE